VRENKYRVNSSQEELAHNSQATNRSKFVNRVINHKIFNNGNSYFHALSFN